MIGLNKIGPRAYHKWRALYVDIKTLAKIVSVHQFALLVCLCVCVCVLAEWCRVGK